MHVSSEQRKMKAWLLLLCLAWAGVSAGPVTITSSTPVRGVFQMCSACQARRWPEMRRFIRDSIQAGDYGHQLTVEYARNDKPQLLLYGAYDYLIGKFTISDFSADRLHEMIQGFGFPRIKNSLAQQVAAAQARQDAQNGAVASLAGMYGAASAGSYDGVAAAGANAYGGYAYNGVNSYGSSGGSSGGVLNSVVAASAGLSQAATGSYATTAEWVPSSYQDYLAYAGTAAQGAASPAAAAYPAQAAAVYTAQAAAVQPAQAAAVYPAQAAAVYTAQAGAPAVYPGTVPVLKH